jgi:hypothetical protein
MLDFAKESIEIPIKKYYSEPDSPISLVFTNKINIDWENLFKLIQLNSEGYITS